MASLMRSARLIRLLPAAARIASRSPTSRSVGINLSDNLTTLPRNSFLVANSRCLGSTPSVFRSTSVQESESESEPRLAQRPIRSDNEFRIVLRRLDDMVRRTGRITKTQLLLVFEEVCKLGTAKPNQALLLIRSCGSLLPEVPHVERTALVSNIWDRLKELGITYDVTHYNALLKVYLQNEHTFSPTDFLAQMEAAGIEPNRITYQRLISAYCLQGDIQGATKILEFMKSKDLPVTEGIFNSLITGHGRAGDLENARNIINVMRSVGLEPSSDTYTALMCAYAEKGDMESITQLTQELEPDSQSLSGRCFLSVAYSLATSGHSEHLPQILDKIQINAGYIPDTINLALSLLTIGQHQGAFDIVQKFEGIRVPETSTDGEPQNQGNFFIDHAVQMQMPHETLFGYLDHMTASGLHTTPYVIALHSALRKVKQNGDYSFGIMRKMVEKGLPVRSHFFWPVFARDVADGNKEGILNAVKVMRELDVEPSTDTYTKYVFPAVGNSLEDIKAALDSLDVPADKSLITALCRNEVRQQRLDNLVSLIKDYGDMVDIPLLRAGLVTCFSRNPQVEPMVHICRHLVDSHETLEDNDITKEDFLGSFLYDIIFNIPEAKTSSLKPHIQLLFSKLAQEGLTINGIRYRGVRNQLDRLKLSMLKPAAMKLVSPDELQTDRVANFDILPGEEVSLEELEGHLVELREKGGNIRGILRKLLLVHAKNNNYDRAMELKKEFDERGYDPTGAIFACIINMCCNIGKYEEALEVKETLRKFDPSFKLDVVKYRSLICHLAKDKKLPVALDLLTEMKELSVSTDRMEKQVFHLLNELALLGLAEEVERLFETMIELEIVKPNNNLLGPVVTSHLNKNDMEGALGCIRDCQAKYNLMPHFQDVLVRLVDEGNTDQLQRAMDFASQQHGDINMLYDLIFAFCSTGKYKEATKLIETPGMIAKNKRLQWYAERCIGAGQEEPLKQLTAITRDLYACDRDQMYFYLIQLNTRNGDADKCLEVWTQMQEEGVVPRDRTMRYLANVLRTHNKQVPFEVPQITVDQLESEKLSSADMIQRLIKGGNMEDAYKLVKEAIAEGREVNASIFNGLVFEMLKLGKIEDALAVKELGENQGNFKMTTVLSSKLLIEYVKKGDIQNAENIVDETLHSGQAPRPASLRVLADYYAKEGNIEQLLSLKERYENQTKSSFPVGKSVLAAFIVKDDLPGALAFIEKEIQQDPLRSRRIGMRSFVGKLLQKDAPMDEVISLVDRLSAQGVEGPAWQLLYAHLDSGKIEGAKHIVEKYPVIQEKSTGLVGYIIEMLDSDENPVEKIERVLELTDGQDYLDRGKVYFYLLRAHDAQKDSAGGLKVKERMEEEGLPVSDFMLKRLALLLKKTGQPIPYEEPPNPLSFYREQLQLESKDNLPEINIPAEES